MKVSFYFDPACPYSWITSRWLLMIADERNVQIKWKPFSLALKNDVLEKTDLDKHQQASIYSLHFLRVSLQAVKKHKALWHDLYTASGQHVHIMEEKLDDNSIQTILKDMQLPAELLKAQNDSSLDLQLRQNINEAVKLVGDDVGVPIIVFHKDNSFSLGYFGPVINELPDKEEALALWDGLSALATSPSFYELKRGRSDAPNTASTARC